MYILLYLTYFFLAILYTVLFIFCFYSVYAMIKGAPFVPSFKSKCRTMIKLAELKNTDTLMDLGSGDGRILFLASDNVKQAVGIEINPVLYHYSKLKNKIKRKQNIEIRRGNLWDADLSEVDVLTLFFIQDKMEKLGKKIKREMKPGSRIISNTFSFPNWEVKKKDGQVKLYIL